MSDRKFRIVRIVLAASLLCLTLAACFPTSPKVPTSHELVGTWVNGDTQLVLSAYGQYTLTNAPAYTKVGRGDKWRDGALPSWDNSGQWWLVGHHVIIEQQDLDVDLVGSEVILEFVIDAGSDNPRCFQLVRAGSPLKPLGPRDCAVQA